MSDTRQTFDEGRSAEAFRNRCVLVDSRRLSIVGVASGGDLLTSVGGLVT